jgi:aldose 1-epimerase
VGLVLSAGSDRVEVDPRDGARLTSLIAGGRERLLTQPPESTDAAALLWGCFFMAPWVGRLAKGKLPWDGQTYRFPLNFGGHAIHGLVFDKEFAVENQTDTSVVLACDLGAAGWPFGGSVLYRVELATRRLALSARVEGSDVSMPVSIGWHPYFLRPQEGDLSVTVDSDHVLETNDDLIPTGRLIPVDDETDLRRGPVLGERQLDHVFARARPPAIVAWPDLELRLDFVSPIETIVVYTPPHAVCVEPQTAWPNAPALHDAGVRGTGVGTAVAGKPFEAMATWTWAELPSSAGCSG